MYRALYRKYRPVDFDSVVGQEAVVKTLKNSIINGSFSHAYMFYGPRGTGKTTISKIFARNINCLENKDGNACGKCEACKFSFSKECVDIIEIDAASNNGVDEIRELRNRISLVPSMLKYKVYIIDEVHMLSTGAFNALLKTLEEPPEHAVFILATTDPQKVPETVVSRCQCFAFKRISSDTIVKRLEYVVKKEKINIEKPVLTNIANLSDGGLRDALGMLDKLSSYSSEKITMDDFININDIVSERDVEKFTNYIFEADIPAVLEKIDFFDREGKNLNQIITQVLHFCRSCIVDYYLKQKECEWSIDLLHEFTNLLNEKLVDIRKSSNPKIYIEMLILKYINDYISIKNDNKTTNVVENTNNVDIKENTNTKIDNNVSLETKKITKNKSKSSKEKKVINIEEIMNVRINNVLAKASKKIKTEEEESFNLLNNYTFDQKIGYLVCNLLDSNIEVVSDDIVLLSFEYASTVEENLQILEKLNDTYSKITGSKKKIAIVSKEKWSKLKEEYIINFNNKHEYTILEEPKPIYEEIKKDDIINNEVADLFGDIVEYE